MSHATTRIIANGFVLTCDPANSGGRLHVAVKDGKIAAISEALAELQKEYPNAPIVDAKGKLVTPGFVNAHVHSDSFLHRVHTEGRHFQLWMKSRDFEEAQRSLVDPANVDDVRALYTAAYFNHLQAGTTFVGEFPPLVDDKGLVAILQSIERTDVRAVVALQSWDHITAARDLGESRPPMILSLGREEDYTVYSFESVTNASQSDNLPIVAHIAELKEGVDAIKKNFQKPPLNVLEDYAVFQGRSFLLHGNYLTDRDFAIIEGCGLPVVLCPRSAALKQSGYPALRGLINGDAFLCLGTDWGRVSMLEEMQFMFNLMITLPGLRQMSSYDLLRMATVNGAHALGVEHSVGSIEIGKSADMVLFSINELRVPPLADDATPEYGADILLQHLNTSDIDAVMIHGEFGLHAGKLTRTEERESVDSLRLLWKKYYPKPVKATQPSPKVLPFVQPPSSEETGGIEHGVEPREENEKPAPAPRVKEERVERVTSPKIQLSKDVRKVFGEDDDS